MPLRYRNTGIFLSVIYIVLETRKNVWNEKQRVNIGICDQKHI